MFAPFLLLALATGCARAAGSVPRLPADVAEVDPLLRERIEQALAACEAGTPGALLELGQFYQANGLGELAAQTFELCLVRGAAELGAEPARVRYHLACSLERANQAEVAQRAFEEARRVAPEYAPAHWRAGNLLLDQGDADAARQAFERALALEPGNIPARLGLARVALLESRPEDVLATLEPLARERPRERLVHGLLARARRALGDEAGASAELRAEERALESSWVDPWAAEVAKRATGVSFAMAKANERLVAGDARGAVELLEPVLLRVPDNLALVLLVVKARIEAGQLQQASELIASARSRFPRQFKLDLYAGLVALARKNFARAKQELESALALNPAFGPTLSSLGEVELQLGDKPAAEQAFERALEQGENDLRTHILFAQVELQLGKLERACALLESVRADFPQSVVPPAHMAEAYARGGRMEEARAALAEAERIDPSFGYLAKVRALVEGGGR